MTGGHKKFVPRQRKRRTLDRERSAKPHLHAGANGETVEIIPASKEEREARKKALKEEIAKQHIHTKVSRAKQKRLDKYIETKLKKEENADLIKKLSEQKHLVDRSLLRSTKDLGRGREERREAFARALKQKEAGINVQEANRILFKRTVTPGSDVSEDENDQQHKSTFQSKDQEQTTGKPVNGTTAFGTGLKRPLDIDDQGQPIIKKRKRQPKIAPSLLFKPPTPPAEEDDIEPEWDGFSNDAEAPSEASIDVEASANDEGENEDLESDGDGSDEPTDADDEEDHQDNEEKRARTSAFKAWAEQSRNEAIGFIPSNALTDSISLPPKATFVPRPKEEDPLPPELIVKQDADRKPHAVNVTRPEELQVARLALPVVTKEQEIMEAIFNNDVVIISGATGSGKTTQVPQFLFENGFGDPDGLTPGMVGITQPRRVAAVSMAKRVADELTGHKERVAHQIRFDTTVGKRTAVKFMTDGVLLREMSEDFSLKNYSAIIIDEAHERTVNTDILIALVSRCVTARAELAKENPKQYSALKLVIMSATLRVSDFRENTRLFKISPPLVQAEGRQYDVIPHWTRRTYPNFVEEAFKKVSRGHRKLPPGGILVFLTGQNEIRMLAKQLKQVFVSTDGIEEDRPQMRVTASEMPVETEDLGLIDSADHFDEMVDIEEEVSEDDQTNDAEEADSEFVIEGEEATSEIMKIHVLPLYSQLPSKEQLRVFEPPPEDSRLIVLATNVAETSLTIPGIRYVFDSGRVKERKWDQAGVQTFQTTWVSKASADQRMGRAGRTGPGHCYRLYSSAVYESFQDFAEPEIYRSPMEGVVLQLKSLGISRIDNFPFPTPPERSSLVKAEALLCHLGALDSNKQITALGKELQNYPLSPRFAQMLRLGHLYNCVQLTIAMVAALDVPELFIPESMLNLRAPPLGEDELYTVEMDHEEKLREARRKAYGSAQGRVSKLSATSDAMKLVAAMIEHSQSDRSDTTCDELFIRQKAMQEANQLREQLTNIIRTLHPGSLGTYKPRLSNPPEKQINLLRQIVAAGFIDQVAIRADCLPSPPEVERKPRRAIDVQYQTLIPSYDSSLITTEEEKYVFLHPSSILTRTSPSKLPRYIVYHRLQRSQNIKEGSLAKTRMYPLTPVSGEQLAVLARGTSLLSISKPVARVTALQSEKGKERRQCHVVLSLVGRNGDLGWPLVRKEVVQRREKGCGWLIEKYVD